MATGGRFTLSLRADVKAFVGQVRAATAAYQKLTKQIRRSATDFKSAASTASRQTKTLGRRAGVLRTNLLDLAIAIRIVAGGFKRITASARELQSGLAKVSTVLTEENLPALGQFETALTSMSVEFGRSTKELSDGLFNILQASVAPAEALKVLRGSAKLATGGFTDMEKSADLLTTVMNTFGKSADEVTEIMDLLFTTQLRGKITIADMSQSLGDLLSTAKVLGLGLEDVMANLAGLTRAGIKPRRAITALNRFLLSFVKNTKESQEAAAELGFQLDVTALQTKGITGAIRELLDQGAGPDFISRLFPRIRGFKAAATIRNVLGQIEDDLETFFARTEGRAEQAFRRATQTADFQLSQLSQGIKQLFADLFTPLLKQLGATENRLGEFFQKVREIFAGIRVSIVLAIITLQERLGIIGRLIGKILRGIFDNIGDFGEFILKSITVIIVNVGKSIVAGAEAIVDNIAIAGKNAFEALTAAIEGREPVFEDFVNVIDAIGDALEAFPDFPDTIGKAIDKATGDARRALSRLDERIESTRKRLVRGMRETIRGAGDASDAVQKSAKDAADGVDASVAASIRKMQKNIKDMRDAAQKGLDDMQDRLDQFQKLADKARDKLEGIQDKQRKILQGAFDQQMKLIGDLKVADSERLGFQINALDAFIAKLKEHGQEVGDLERDLADLRRQRAEALADDIAEQLENSSNRAIEALQKEADALKATINDIEASNSRRRAAQDKLNRVERKLELEKLRQRRFDIKNAFAKEQTLLTKARERNQITEQEFQSERERLRRGRIASELEALSQILDKEVLNEGERAKLEKQRRKLAAELNKERVDGVEQQRDAAIEASRDEAKKVGRSAKEQRQEEKRINEEFDAERKKAEEELLRATGKAREVKAKEAAEKAAEEAIKGQEDELSELDKQRRAAEEELKKFEDAANAVAKSIADFWSKQMERIKQAVRELGKALLRAGLGIVPGGRLVPLGPGAPLGPGRRQPGGPLPGGPGGRVVVPPIPPREELEEEEAAREAERERRRLPRGTTIVPDPIEPEELLPGAREELERRREAQRRRAQAGIDAEEAAQEAAKEAERQAQELRELMGIRKRGRLERARRAGMIPEVLPEDFVDPFGRGAPGTTPSRTVNDIGSKLDRIIECVCNKSEGQRTGAPQVINVKVDNQNEFTGLPSNIDVKRVSKKVSREMADKIGDQIGLPPSASFTGE